MYSSMLIKTDLERNIHVAIMRNLQELIVIFFFFLREEKGDSRVAVIVPRPTVQLGKPMGITSSNWNSETPNPHTPQALLISETSKNCNYSPRENSNLGCGESLSSHISLWFNNRWYFFLSHMIPNQSVIPIYMVSLN